MLSNLANFFFGGNNANNEQDQVQSSNHEEPLIISNTHTKTEAPQTGSSGTSTNSSTEEDWVMVGLSSGRAPILGSLNEMVPRPPVTGSTGSSAASSMTDDDGRGEILEDEDLFFPDDEDEAQRNQAREVQLPRSARRLTSPFSHSGAVTVPQMKALRSAQKSAKKESTKGLTSKATSRKSKAVKNQNISGGKVKFVSKANLSMKSAGLNKQLKQC